MYPSQFYKKLYESAVRDDKSSTYVSSSYGIDFSKISSDTNGKGLYISSEYSDYKYPILYYRGDVDNNNLIFANFCWKIVRTTETGGIKLIYNGVPSNGTCDNTGEDSQIGTSAFNTNYNSLAYVGYMYGTPYTYNSKSISSFTGTYYYGNDVTYSNGIYTLTETISSSNFPSLYNIKIHHYTCMGGTTCSTVYYIYYTESNTMYYISLTGGKKVEDALSEMLDNNDTSSKVKNVVDNWYYSNIEQKGYSDYLEDTVWCSDRSINESGWTNSAPTIQALRFGSYNSVYINYTPNLECSRNMDKFTVNSSNGNGELDYPVGLLTASEIMMAGGLADTPNNNYYLYNGSLWWTQSPSYLDHVSPYFTYLIVVRQNGSIINGNVQQSSIGVRPSISLAPGVDISSGNGTINSPYQVG